ncbi:unnamed protein product [Sphagnum jensenii]|uniref:DUF4005 domain-containing protein n=1 Tax=Sphagnum jensenii TaxID=128206 RepID=A0ABP1AV81_9BRYO
MGKPHKSVGWFKAVKKAFRSPSKEKADNKDDTAKKVDAGDKCATIPASLTAPLQEPTPLPLPSPKKGSFSEAEQEQEKKLHVAVVEAATDPPVIVDNYNEEVEHKEESLVASDAGQEGINSSNGDHCEEEEEEVWNEEHFGSPAAEATVTTIEQRFGGLVALKALVRLQALVRGHIVRKEAATTLRTIQALVRVQALIRGHQVRLSKEGQGVQDRLLQHRQLSSRPNKASEGCWDASTGSVQDSVAKTQSREVGARKRERAMAYAFSKQLKHGTPNPTSLSIDCDSDQPHWGWSWLERWTAARPWQNHHFIDQEYSQTLSPGKFSGDSRKEVESGSVTEAKDDVMQLPPVIYNEVEDSQLEPYTPEDPLSPDAASFPTRVPPSLSALDESTPVPLSPLASEDSLHMPSSTTVEAQLSSNFPGVSSPKEVNGVAKHAKLDVPTSFESPDSLSLKDGYEHEQQGRTGKMSLKQAPTDHAVPTSFKSTTSRYMTATESAKAKFRSHSNPKSRNPEEMEMPIKPQRRLSQGGNQFGKANSPSTTTWNQSVKTSQANPKGRMWNEKFEGDIGTKSPNRRDSYGGGAAAQQGIRWR